MEQYFKSPDNQIFCLDTPGFEHLLVPDCVEITKEEATAIANPPPPIEVVREKRVETIYANYVAARAQDVSYTTVDGVVQTFQADAPSSETLKSTIIGLQGAAQVPPGFFWVATDNTLVPFTYADLLGLAQAMLFQGWAAFQKLQVLKEQIRNAQTPEDVQVVVW